MKLRKCKMQAMHVEYKMSWIYKIQTTVVVNLKYAKIELFEHCPKFSITF
jgi:hypothetical protein